MDTVVELARLLILGEIEGMTAAADTGQSEAAATAGNTSPAQPAMREDSTPAPASVKKSQLQLRKNGGER